MKKLIAFLMVLAMLCCGIAVAETATDVTGTWYAGMAGVIITLNVSADGTLSMDVAGMDSNEGVWEIDGSTFYINRGQEDETVLDITADGSLADPSGYLTFGREPIEAVVLPEIVPAADASVFNGTWNASIISAYGMTLSIEEAFAEGLGSLFGLEEGEQALTMVIDNGAVSFSGSETMEMNFAEDHLELILGEDEETAALNQYVYTTEDGIEYEMLGIQIFFTKAE